MAALMVLESIAIVLLALLVAGLLKSHAEILRALNHLGVDLGHGSSGHANTQGIVSNAEGSVLRIRSNSKQGGSSLEAADVSGQSPYGEVVHIAVREAPRPTLLAFLSSGCSSCHAFWSRLDSITSERLLPSDVGLVVVTRSPQEESESSVRALASDVVPVVMSNDAWRNFDVKGSPYFVFVESHATSVAGQGVAHSWEQVAALLNNARADVSSANSAVAGERTLAASTFATGAQREARADQDLQRAGIYPGDPSLYSNVLAVEKGKPRS